jgi:replicative DNA helicase
MDAVIAVYRDEYYDENSKDKGIAEVIVRKSRDGELGTAHVRSELHYSRFSNLSGYND